MNTDARLQQLASAVADNDVARVPYLVRKCLGDGLTAPEIMSRGLESAGGDR